MLVTIPHRHTAFRGLTIPHLPPAGISHEQSLTLFEALGPKGRRYYGTVQIPLDTLSPLLGRKAIALASSRLAKAASWPEWARRTVTLIPLAIPIAEWSENAVILLMLRTFPTIPGALPRIGSVASLAKTTCVILALLMLQSSVSPPPAPASRDDRPTLANRMRPSTAGGALAVSDRY